MSPLRNKLLRQIGDFSRASSGQIAVTLALLLIPLLAAAGGAIEFSGVSSVKSNMQDALDSAALELAKNGPSLASNQYQTSAQTIFNSNFHAATLSATAVTATYDPTTQTAVVNGSGSYATMLLKLVGIPTISVTGSATAQTSSKWPICVDITSPLGKHTLLTSGASGIKFNSCMVQVNTSDWDAVEARNTSSIASTNGDNCFVGDIHYGNVTPAKDASCTMFPDPFSGYAIPSDATCDHTDMTVTASGASLSSGVYCGGLTISASTTLNPGVYILKDGGLTISGGTVTGNGVTFIFTGTQITQATASGPGPTAPKSTQGGGFYIYNSAAVTFSPDTGADAGKFAGFVFYFDPASAASCNEVNDGGQLNTPPKVGVCESVVDGTATLNVSGVTYLVGTELLVSGSAKMTVNPGTLMVDFLADSSSAQFSLTNTSSAATSAQIALQKSGKGFGVALVR